MTGLDVLGEPSNSHFGFIAHRRDGVIFHPHILHNDGYHGLHDDDSRTGKIFGMDSLAIAAAQTEGGKVKKKTKFKTMCNVNKSR